MMREENTNNEHTNESAEPSPLLQAIVGASLTGFMAGSVIEIPPVKEAVQNNAPDLISESIRDLSATMALPMATLATVAAVSFAPFYLYAKHASQHQQQNTTTKLTDAIPEGRVHKKMEHQRDTP
jgi:hypothetical protein